MKLSLFAETVLTVCQKREHGSRKHICPSLLKKKFVWILFFSFLFLLQGLDETK